MKAVVYRAFGEAPRIEGQTVLMNLSGRGDKDVAQMMKILADADGDI